jgi:hypothetical protein
MIILDWFKYSPHLSYLNNLYNFKKIKLDKLKQFAEEVD